MGRSIFIAQVLGLAYLVIGFGLLLNRQAFRRVLTDFCENAFLEFLSGLFALVLGIVIILKHQIWVVGWPVLITLIGWLAFIKGTWIILFPNSVFKITKVYLKNESLLVLHAVAVLFLGIVFTFLGFFA